MVQDTILGKSFGNFFVELKRRILVMSLIGLQLPEGGDFQALHCQTSTDFNRSIAPDLTTEPPLLGRCCYVQ